MKRSEFPANAFGYADGDIRLLLHHDPARVKSGAEHDTVNPLLLMYALDAVDIIPVAGGESERSEIRRHLQAHANVILWSNPDTSGLPIALQDQLRDYAFFKANLTGTSEVPPVTTEARGCIYVSLDKRTYELSWYGHYLGLSGDETSSHFHTGMDGKVGEMVVAVGVGNPKVGSVVLSEDQTKQLFDGAFYFNVHSSNYPVGEIRGRVIPAAISRSNNGLTILPAVTREQLLEMAKDPSKAPKEWAEQLEKFIKSDIATAAVWTTETINGFPDSSFAVVEKGGKKDKGGKTVPRNYRHLPYKDAAGKIDVPHLRNALARMNQLKAVSPSDSTERIRSAARKVLVAAAKKHLPSTKFAKQSEARLSQILSEIDDAIGSHHMMPGECPNMTDCPRPLGTKMKMPKDSHGAEVVIPPGTEVRPGIIETGDKEAGTLENGSIAPAVEKDPKPDIKQLEPAGDNGAVYNNHLEKTDKTKIDKPKKDKNKVKKPDYAGSSRLDYGKALVNIVVEPNQQPLSNETQNKVRETGNATGVASSPPVDGAISFSNLNDPMNADLKKEIDNVLREAPSDRPGAGSIKLRDRVVSLMSEKNFAGRVVIFPVTGGEKSEYKVLRVETTPKMMQMINELPDSSFALIERGSKKDDSGKTLPRSHRHLPYKDASGKVDFIHLRNALVQMNQINAMSLHDSTDRIRRVARSVLIAAAKKYLPDSQFAKSDQFRISEMLAEIDVALMGEIIGGKLGKIDAQLIEVAEQRTTKLFQLKMGDKDNPTYFYVTVQYDGDGKAINLVFDYSSYLPADVVDDFVKFLKQLPKKG